MTAKAVKQRREGHDQENEHEYDSEHHAEAAPADHGPDRAAEQGVAQDDPAASGGGAQDPVLLAGAVLAGLAAWGVMSGGGRAGGTAMSEVLPRPLPLTPMLVPPTPLPAKARPSPETSVVHPPDRASVPDVDAKPEVSPVLPIGAKVDLASLSRVVAAVAYEDETEVERKPEPKPERKPELKPELKPESVSTSEVDVRRALEVVHSTAADAVLAVTPPTFPHVLEDRAVDQRETIVPGMDADEVDELDELDEVDEVDEVDEADIDEAEVDVDRPNPSSPELLPPEPTSPDLGQVDTDEDDLNVLLIEVADRLQLSLKNDTGMTPEQKTDGITSDATVEVAGVDELQGKVEYRIGEGPWTLLGDGKLIDGRLFVGDGPKRVAVRPMNAEGASLDEVSMSFVVDRTRPRLMPLEVLHEQADVTENGDPHPLGIYALTNQAQVRIPGWGDWVGWDAKQFELDGNEQISPPFDGSTEMLPDVLFREGPQLIGVRVWDQAGNLSENLQRVRVWLDTTPPPAPNLLSWGDMAGVEQVWPKALEPHAHLALRSDPSSDWHRLQEGDRMMGPAEIRQVDLAGNASLQTVWLTASQVLVPTSIL